MVVSSKTLFILALAAVHSTLAASPSSLKITVTSAATTVKSKDITLSATVTNPTHEDIKFIRFGSLLDSLPTRSFKVMKEGKEVAFSGISVTPNLEHEDTWVTVPAGQSRTVEHKVGFDYNFAAAGPGKYTFEPANTFQTPSQTTRVKADIIEINVTEVEGRAETEQTTPVCNDRNRLNILTAGLAEARALAGGAATDIRSHPNSGQYAAYFGNSNRDTVWWNFDRIAGDLPSSGVRGLYCQDSHNVCAPNPGIIAYTWLVTDGSGNIVGSDIFACNSFWGYPATHEGTCQGRQRDTRGGILLHELTHAVFKSTDIYGCSAARNIPDSQKINNADNYACFGAQIYRDYNC